MKFVLRNGKNITYTHIQNVLAIEKRKYGCKVVCIDSGKKAFRIIKAKNSYNELKEFFQQDKIPFYGSPYKSINIIVRDVTRFGKQ